MKTKIIGIGIAVFFSAFFHIPATQAEVLAPVIISEVQIGGIKAADDFIELYNPNPTPVNISGYRLRYKNSSATSPDQSLREIPKNTCVSGNSYYLWANKDGVFSDNANTTTATNIASHYSIALFTQKSSGEAIIDSVAWGSDSRPFDALTFTFPSNPEANESMVRDIVTGDWLPNFSATPTPTHSTDTSCSLSVPTLSPLSSSPTPDPAVPSPPTPITAQPASIRINEIFPNPTAKGDAGEFIELHNFGTELADISGWILRDATKTGKYTLPSGTIIAADAYFVATDQDFKLSLNNSNETISLFDVAGTLIDSVRYATAKEGVSLNYMPVGWRGGTPTPGMANILNTLPETNEKVPKKGFKNTPVTFNAKGKDADGDTLKYTWDFGDGHKSYKAAASHAYAENGTYTVTLKTTDGSDDIVETFAIEIRSYPRPNIRITSLMPNSAGNDADNEWIMIENRGKKDVNLKGFGIATGWKNLSNHPIREDFIIGPKKEAKLTRTFSLFTLSNQKGKVELRAPDGKVLQKIKYKLDTSIDEDVSYRKKKGGKWSFEKIAAEIEADSPIVTEEDTEQENAPDADTDAAATTGPEETEGAVLGASTTAEVQSYRYARNRQWFKLLNVGTRVRIPDNVVFIPDATIAAATAQTRAPSKRPSIRNAFSDLNTSLNGLLNGVR